MDPERWNELDRLFEAALDLPAEERDGFLARQDLSAAERERLNRMLEQSEANDDFLGDGALGGRLADAFLLEDQETSPPVEEIRGYRLLRVIGSGGMGHVWEADQIEPVRRKVAIKIIRPIFEGDRVVERFEAERQTLARMNHPAIAQIFDAGVTESGRPFFAMELVEGETLTKHCDEARLGIRARLRLFLDVCDAIEHAHRRGVIHRDLKPSNLLVSTSGSRPLPKVIDFGIARLADDVAEGGMLLTDVGTIVGTPEYMSPEQAGTDPTDVDTRVDVYSLGVVLYELLTGRIPHRRTDSSPARLAALFEEIRSREVRRPSRCLEDQGEEARYVALRRGTSLEALRRMLRRDLDWIVLRALEKDRTRRYGSVGELADEIRRFLRDEPVEAGPPGASYRLGKFLRRHRGLITATGAVLLALVAGLVGTMTGLLRARDEAARAQTQARIAEEVNTFLNDDLLAAVRPETQGRDVTMLQVLDAAATRLDGKFAEQPEVEASLRETIGSTYFSLGQLDEAAPLLERAIALYESALGPEDPHTLAVVHSLGELRFYQGRLEEAAQVIERVAHGRERALGPSHELTIAALSDLGAVAQARDDLVSAESYYRTAHERARESLAEDNEFRLSIQHNLGALLDDLGRNEEAITILEQTYRASRDAMGEEHPQTLTTLSLLGTNLREAGRLDEAEPVHVRVLGIRRRVLGDEHPATMTSANNLGVLLEDRGEYDQAVAIHRENLERQRRILGDRHDATILTLANLGIALVRGGRPVEAEPLLLEALSSCEETLGHGHSLCASTARKYGDCLTAEGRYAEAAEVLLPTYDLASATFGAEHPTTRTCIDAIVRLYEAWDRPDDATRWRAKKEPGS